MFNKIFFVSLLILPLTSKAALQAVELNIQSTIPQTRWIFNKKSKDLKPNFKKLADLKNAQVTKNYVACNALGRSLYATEKILRPWILSVRMDCQHNLTLSKKGSIEEARKLNSILKSQPQWMLTGPYKNALKAAVVNTNFDILDWEIHNRPQIAWSYVGDLLDLQDWMTKEQKARSFQMAGELAFLQQNLATAKVYVLKSLELIDDPKLREKLNAIESALEKPETTTLEQMAQQKPEAIVLGIEEQKIVDRMTGALKSGDLFSATQDGVSLIRDYPNSVQSDWASDRIIESYLSIAAQDEKNYKVLRYDFINVMKKADSRRLTDWARKTYKAGQYKDAATLAEEAYNKCKDDFCNLEVLNLTATSFLATHDLDKAEKYFKLITERESGTKDSTEAYLNWGLIQYINKDYSKALLQFEKVVSQTQFPDYELTARYWLWRTAQKVDKDRAQVELQTIAQKFPFSYYGLRAIAEANGGQVSFDGFNKKVKLKQQLWLTPFEKQAWDRFMILSGAGWYDEANAELSELPAPLNPEGLAMFARMYAATFNYSKAIRILNQVWDQNPDLRVMSLIQTAFPKEFTNFITDQSSLRKIDPKLVMGLIRQESAFNVSALSSSGALGLMQIIPPTARELAPVFKIKNIVLPDQLFDPETNVKMGTYYISKLVTDFGNNVPFGLAAYNAGPTKIKKWMQSMQLTPQASSNPDYEVWIDLLPWSETRFYVKAILRNYLIYQLIDSQKIQVKDPVWTTSQG